MKIYAHDWALKNISLEEWRSNSLWADPKKQRVNTQSPWVLSQYSDSLSRAFVI